MKPIHAKSDNARNPNLLLARRFLREIRTRWWIPLITVAGMALLAQFALPRNHEEVATYQGRMWVSGKIQLEENSAYQEEVQDYYGTQMELMQSSTIQNRATEAVEREIPGTPAIPIKLTATLSPRGAVILVTASGTNSGYVRDYLDAVMDQYLEYKRQVRVDAATVTVTSISNELDRIDKDTEKAQERLDEFRRTNSFAELLEQGGRTGSYLEELNRKLAGLNMRYRFLTLLSSNQIYEGSLLVGNPDDRAADSDASAGADSKDAYGDALRQLSQLKAKRDYLSQNLRPKHPVMIELESEIRSQENLIEFARSQNGEELTNAEMALKLDIENTQTAIRDWEDRALSQSGAMAEYDHLKTDVERANRQHDYLLSVVHNIGVNKDLDQDSIAVLERARPVPPVLVRRLPSWLLGGVAGLFAGLGTLIVLIYTNDNVTSAEELDGLLSVPVIGQIPEVDQHEDELTPLLLKSGDSRHCFAESLKGIRSALYYCTVDGRRPKSLLVTSALPGEGKSTVAANLAQAFACSGYRILLIDGDLRCGVLPGLLRAPSEPGLTDVLQDGRELHDTIVETRIPNLSFLPPGRPVNNPGELFLSTATDNLLAQVYKDYDFIVIDSVPVLAADDTTSLAPKVEGIVFVVRGSSTKTRSAQRALELLHNRQGCVLGAVCNFGSSDLLEYDYYAKSGKKNYART